jgi:diguanylate cyclase (GGDEF)-like protein
VAILPGSDAAAALQIAERLRREIHDMSLDHLVPGLRLSVSLGVTAKRPEQDTLDQLLKRADRALYRAKELGRNRVELANP